MSQSSPSTPSTTTSSAGRKPRVSLAIATAFGLGYLPKAPGTFGSLVGVAAMALYWSRVLPIKSLDLYIRDVYFVIPLPQSILILVTLLVSVVGVIVASNVANYL